MRISDWSSDVCSSDLLAPSACTANIRQERIGWPSNSTLQAPQTPCSQPTWVPVRPATSRRKSTSVIRALTVASYVLLLTVSRIGWRDISLHLCPQGLRPGFADRPLQHDPGHPAPVLGGRMKIAFRLDDRDGGFDRTGNKIGRASCRERV